MGTMMVGIISLSFVIGLVVVIAAPTFTTAMLGAVIVVTGMVYALEKLIFSRIGPLK